MIFDRLETRADTNINEWKDIYTFANGYDITPFETGLKEQTYYSCIKIISESIAKCSLQVKQETDKGEIIAKEHYLSSKLRLRPNPYMSAIDCIKTFVVLSKHEGISGLYINHNNRGQVEGLYPANITHITIDNMGLIKGTKLNKVLYDFTLAGNDINQSCFDKDMIILRDFTLNGIETKANKSILRESLDTSIKSQNYLNTLFTNGLTNRIVCQLSSDIKDENDLKKIQEKFSRIYSNNGKIFTVPAGYSVTSLNLSLADAQYAELRKMSKEEIASSFNVPLSKLGIKAEVAKTNEQDNLDFLVDCLQVIFQAIEQEMDWKLLTEKERLAGYKIRFNVGVLLRLDAKTQSEVISTYVKNGIYDLDLARGILGVEKLGGEPIITLPSGQVLLRDLLAGKVSYIKGGGKDDNA